MEAPRPARAFHVTPAPALKAQFQDSCRAGRGVGGEANERAEAKVGEMLLQQKGDVPA